MRTYRELESELRRIDGRGYKAYKNIEGSYEGPGFTLIIDHVQGDPFAEPSRVRAIVNPQNAAFPEETMKSRSREIALRDFLTRKFSHAVRRHSKGNRGSGKSGAIYIDCPGQEILDKTSVIIKDGEVEARFRMGLPARGRSIAGRDALDMFMKELPAIVNDSLFFCEPDRTAILRHVCSAEDGDFIRDRLNEMGLVAFVADGSILPRKSGIDPRPMDSRKAVPFTSPESMKIEIELLNAGRVSGMAVPSGITLIVGGGYHGKSTLLDAIELGIYNHVPGDGREMVITDRSAFKVRAEDGRRIERTCITPFISNLPLNQDTDSFSTEDASGSTSQAANIMEAVEIGTSLLLIDEDTSATNFMIRDHRMQELVSKDREPITPFIDRVSQLKDEMGISTILVMGGSGDYFDAADRVICMDEFAPRDVTEQALAIAVKYRAERNVESGGVMGEVSGRIPVAESLDASRGKRDVKISGRGTRTIIFGVHEIDLSSVEQIVHDSQTRAIGDAIHYSKRYMDGRRTLKDVITLVMKDIKDKGMDAVTSRKSGEYGRFRELEFTASLNRLRTLKVK